MFFIAYLEKKKQNLELWFSYIYRKKLAYITVFLYYDDNNDKNNLI